MVPTLNRRGLECRTNDFLISVRCFKSQPGARVQQTPDRHRILLNLQDQPLPVRHWRERGAEEISFAKHEVIISPVGAQSSYGWSCAANIVEITLDPGHLRRFALTELGLLLDPKQLCEKSQVWDRDLCMAGNVLSDAMATRNLALAFRFDGLSRLFLAKLLRRYGRRRPEDISLSAALTPERHQRILDLIRSNLNWQVTLDELAEVAGMGALELFRIFDETLGVTPMHYARACQREFAVQMMRHWVRPTGENDRLEDDLARYHPRRGPNESTRFRPGERSLATGMSSRRSGRELGSDNSRLAHAAGASSLS